MNKYILLTVILFFLVGCIGQKEETASGEFTFPDTGLSIVVPENWLKTNIPGNKYPILFTEIDYGIKPNIQLEVLSSGVETKKISESYFNGKIKMYPDYTILEESIFTIKENTIQATKIKAKRINKDNTPIIHLSYIFNEKATVIIFSATCAEPSLQKYEEIFDTTIKTLKS